MKLEALAPIRINRPDGEALHLKPGCPIDVPDELGARILERLPNKVRIAEPTCIEAAITPDGNPLSEIYWETRDGWIAGPATPEFLAKSGNQFWIVTSLQGQARWVNADWLRSKKQFEQQKPLREVELIREVR